MFVIGGTGLIGSKTVAIFAKRGHEVVAGSPKSGVNTITGKGLKEAMAGAQVAIDLANSPSFEDKAVLEFLETSGRNLLAAEAAAGVRHHVALSIVGTDRSDNGYFRAKAGIPYTIIRATQVRMETRLGFRPACSNPSRRTTLLLLSPRWRLPRRETESSRLPARNERLSTNSSPTTHLAPTPTSHTSASTKPTI